MGCFWHKMCNILEPKLRIGGHKSDVGSYEEKAGTFRSLTDSVGKMSRRILCGCAMVFLFTGAVHGGEFPLWEAGAGVAGLTLPDYRGSDQRHLYAFPIPYLVYRGDILKVDRSVVRGLLLRSDRIEFDVSLNASPPVNSGRNRTREGMPNLDPTGEIGPLLIIKLGKSDILGSRVSVQLPLRVVAATDLTYLKQVGYVFNPRITFDWPLDPLEYSVRAGLAAGPLYYDKGVNDYYYSVTPAFATASRPAYTAPGGYGGFQVLTTVSKRFEKTWFGAFLSFDDLHRAVFENSPLVKTRYSVMAGFAMSWVIDISNVKVTAEE